MMIGEHIRLIARGESRVESKEKGKEKSKEKILSYLSRVLWGQPLIVA